MTIPAILCFVVKDGKILLIDKKTGLGRGKINGPGGKIEKGESPEQTALRELKEEIGIIPVNPEVFGELDFFYSGGEEPDWRVFVLKTEHFEGELKDSKEATPFWTPIDDIPYDKMWHDDTFWMPVLLQNKKFKGKFFFDKENNVVSNYKLEILEF